MKVFVRDLRRHLGYRGLSRQAVYNWERGVTPVPAAVLVAASRVVGVSVEQLLSRVAASKQFAGDCVLCGGSGRFDDIRCHCRSRWFESSAAHRGL